MLVPSIKPAKELEKEVTEKVRGFLKNKGWRPIRMQRTVLPGQFQTGEAGIPDFLFLYHLKPGITAALWVEFKRPGGTLRKGQPEWHAKERKIGALVWVVENFGDFETAYTRQFGWLHDGRLPGQVEMMFE